MSEMLTYGVDLTSMTQGRGSFTWKCITTTSYRGAAGEDHREGKAARGEVKEEEE